MNRAITLLMFCLPLFCAKAQDLKPHFSPVVNLAAVAVDTNSASYQAELVIAKYAPLLPPASAWQAFALQFTSPHITNQTMHLDCTFDDAHRYHLQYSYDLLNWFDIPTSWVANMPDGKTLSIVCDRPVCFYRMKGDKIQ